MRRPHDVWAAEYDGVLEGTFGRTYQAFTEETLHVVRERLPPPADIVDFGAGTGRLALPLAARGYGVTAVDPSAPMLERLAAKEREGAGQPGRTVTRVVSAVEDFQGERDHDLALCVFSVIGYLLDASALNRGAHAMASALRSGGRLLVDVPGPDVFESFEIEADDLLRCVDIDPVDGADGPLYRYREHTAILNDGAEHRFEDTFFIRRWAPDEVVGSLAGAGFRMVENLSPRFRDWGADYLLLRLDD